jgi:hypothetical protein
MYRKGTYEGTSAFLTISCGQIVSVLGSGLTGFALSIWVLQRSGSATRYGLLLLFTTLPSIVLTPLAAGVATDAVGLRGVLLIDFASYCFAVLTVASARGAAPVRGDGGGTRAAFELRGLLFGWTYIRRRPPMLRMLLYFAAVNVSLYMASALVRPLILSFTSAAALGVVVSSSSAGLLAGALLMGTWGGPTRRVRGILGFGLGPGRGMGLLVVVLGASIILFTAVAGLDPRLRAAEEELPDGLAGESPAGRGPVAEPSGANA